MLSGAGTSAFIGQCLAPALALHIGRRVDAIATTDVVAGPQLWLQDGGPTLLVSFARSGNSPESVAAADLAEQALTEAHHLFITCNAEGALAAKAGELRSALALVMPDATNDRSFAMTSSFSSMLLAAALVFGLVRQKDVARLREVLKRPCSRAGRWFSSSSRRNSREWRISGAMCCGVSRRKRR